MNTPEQNFAALGLSLPPAPKPLGVYKPCLIDGKYLYLSGHGTVKDDGSLIIGRIGDTINPEDGKLAARQVGLAMLATIKANIGSLDKVKQCVKLGVFVNSTAEYIQQPQVANGASDLIAEVIGKHARAAVSCNSLPLGVAVEVEAIFEVE